MEPRDRFDYLLEHLEDGCELVFRTPGCETVERDPLHAVWRRAADEAASALAAWRSTRSTLTHAAYLAAADQADAAHDALARRALASAAGV